MTWPCGKSNRYAWPSMVKQNHDAWKCGGCRLAKSKLQICTVIWTLWWSIGINEKYVKPEQPSQRHRQTIRTMICGTMTKCVKTENVRQFQPHHYRKLLHVVSKPIFTKMTLSKNVVVIKSNTAMPKVESQCPVSSKTQAIPNQTPFDHWLYAMSPVSPARWAPIRTSSVATCLESSEILATFRYVSECFLPVSRSSTPTWLAEFL